MTNLNTMGKEYTLSHLEENDANPNPFIQFNDWLEEAINLKIREPNAMNLATVDASGRVSSRMMLCKYVDENGFVFFSNYNSDKAHALTEHPQAALHFWWPEIERQIRIEGTTRLLDPTHSDDYFNSRSRESNIAALLSKQSQVLADKEELINQYHDRLAQHPEKTDIKRPSHWGGYVLSPTRFEFWQGGPHRLHDRLCYQKSSDGSWVINRLYP